jgi:hypothetical protein
MAHTPLQRESGPDDVARTMPFLMGDFHCIG